MNRISSNYEENTRFFDDALGAGRSCDMVCRDLYVGGRRARFWVIDGFGGDAILERMGGLLAVPGAGGPGKPDGDAAVRGPLRDLHGGECQL